MKHIPKKKRLIAFAIVLFAISCAVAFTGCDQRSTEQKKTDSTTISTEPATRTPEDSLPQEKEDLPKFTLLKDTSYEDAGTAKVIWVILVPPDITKESLSNLLNDLYSQGLAKRFKQHDQATVIDIKAYMSKEHAESGMGQWVGWINKSGGRNQPSLSFDDRQINQLGKKAEEKFGLAEDKRKEIWKEAVLVEDRANREAEQEHPEPKPYSKEAYMAAYEKREKLSDELMNKYRNQLAKKYGLSRKELDEIRHEGLEKSWPLPN